MAKNQKAVATVAPKSAKGKEDPETVIEGKVVNPPVFDGNGAKEARHNWIAALKGIESATGALRKAFAGAVKTVTGAVLDENGKVPKDHPVAKLNKQAKAAKALLRLSLIEWSVEAGIKKVTAASTISRLFADAGLKMKAGGGTTDADKVAKAATILALVHKEFPEAGDVELKSLLRLAWQSL